METEFIDMPAPHRACGLKYSGPAQAAETSPSQVDPPPYMFLGRDADDSKGRS